MDIKTKAVAETAFLQLNDAAGEPMVEDGTPVGVTLYGPGSKPFQEAQSRNQNRLVDRVKKKGKSDVSADERIKDQAEFLASITVGFQNLEYDKLTGRELAIAVYSDPSLGFITAQVNGWAGDWANFTPGSATS